MFVRDRNWCNFLEADIQKYSVDKASKKCYISGKERREITCRDGNKKSQYTDEQREVSI